MAPADAGDFLLDADDDDFFGDYNPHPYQGGYDLAATFGTPLPPSSNICYPVSSSSAATAAVPAIPSPPPSSTPKPEEPHGDEKAQRDPAHEIPDAFPDGAAKEEKARRDRRRGRGFWRKKESGEDAISVEVEVAPQSVGMVEADDATGELVQTNDLSWHSNNRDETDTCSQSMSNSYYTSSFARSYGLHGVLGKPDWFLNFSYSESHLAEEFQHEVALSYNNECKISDQPIHCYHHHCYIQSLDVQVKPPEPVSSERLKYYEHFSTYGDQSDIHILETPAHAHNIQSYTRTSDLPLEPFKPSYSENWGFYDAYTQGNALENDKYSLVSGEYGGIGSLFISPFYPGETESFELVPGDEHASFEHNWHNLRYRNMPMDDVSLITQPAEDSYSMMNGSSWPFEEHSAYNV
ncbi:uncharacterized protein LOC110431837 isoform X2 [Sorghum bicolor]|uniref:uncharacterized protein LOC110431837 isoform X2 n=1 Tax=Sorghum bicolor TaxID=4558 RepID=UPI000B426067|nr:uncharacterized protein LOC110431837 isoform X2 [Sorghum bicolor]|eukprot:XP_021307188.1 uncharacterized protein LOC110431837 isoform X2 [Sorghum bicolor]